MYRRDQIVDADGHIMEPTTLWQSFMDPKYKDRCIRIQRDELDGDKLIVNGAPSRRVRRLGGILYSPSGESINWDSLDRLDFYASYQDSCHPASYDPRERLAWMDRQSIDISILFPSLGLIWTNEAISDPDYVRAGLQAYNRWILEFCEVDRNRLVAVAQTALFDQRQAISDLRQLKEAGFAHIMLPLIAPGFPSCFHSDYADFWTALQELNLVVHLHKVAIPHQLNIPSGSPMGCDGNGPFFNHVNETLAAQMCLASLMDNRIPDRFPNIKFAFLECNAGWLPGWLDRADESYEVLQSKGTTLLQAPPRHYIEDLDTFFFGLSLAEDVTRLTSMTDRLLIATDFPHPGASTSPANDWSNRLDTLTPQARTSILGGNALRLLGLETDTVRRDSLCLRMHNAE